jgi:hypothetical protein
MDPIPKVKIALSCTYYHETKKLTSLPRKCFVRLAFYSHCHWKFATSCIQVGNNHYLRAEALCHCIRSTRDES